MRGKRHFLYRSAWLSAVIIAAASIATPGIAESDPHLTLAAKDRALSGGRAVQVILPQHDIEPIIDIGRVAADNGGTGGILGAIIVAARDKKHETLTQRAQDKATLTLAPLRTALTGYDVDGLARSTTEKALATSAWFQPQSVTTSKSDAPDARQAFTNAASADQIAFLTYYYKMSPDFTQVRVSVDVALARKDTGKGTAKSNASAPFYRQTIVSIVQLRTRSYVAEDNIALWSAEDGKRVKAGLTLAFAELERLIPYALELDPANFAQLTDKKRDKSFAAGFYGPVLARDTDGTDGLLLWSKALLHVQSLD